MGSSEEREEVERTQKDKTLLDENVDTAASMHGIKRKRPDREWARSDHREENSGIWKKEDELRLGGRTK